MALIEFVSEENAQGEVANVYNTLKEKWGFVPDALKLFSPSEFLINHVFSSIGYFSTNMDLGGKLLALIRLMVSEEEKCVFCISMNRGILMQYGFLPEQLDAIQSDIENVSLPENEKSLLKFALKVVKNSSGVTSEDVQGLKSLGWTDKQILEAAYHATNQLSTDKLFNAFQINNDM